MELLIPLNYLIAIKKKIYHIKKSLKITLFLNF